MWRKLIDSLWPSPGPVDARARPTASEAIRELVRAVYQAAADGEPTETDLRGWASRVSREGYHYLIRIAGEIGERKELRRTLRDEVEMLEFLARLHRRLLERDLDTTALAQWLPYVRDGHLGLVLRGIVGSEEFLSKTNHLLSKARAATPRSKK